jgi:DNA-directed RNA polymerase subunit L
MELKTIKKTTKELEVEITGETETLLNPITEVFMSNHPESNKRRLYIRVKKGKPEDALKKAVKQLEAEIKSFSKIFATKSKSKK